MHKFFIIADNSKENSKIWKEVTYQEFKKIKEDNPKKCFLDLPPLDTNDYWYTFEVPIQEYKKQKSANNHNYYLRKQQEINDLSLGEPLSFNGDFLHNSVLISSNDTAEIALNRIQKEELLEALKQLNEEEIRIIKLIYLDNPDEKSEAQIARELGMAKSTLNYKKNKIIKKIKKMLDIS